MTTVRRQVDLEEHEAALLRALAQKLGVTEAELIRLAVDRAFGGATDPGRRTPPEAWEEARAYYQEWAARNDRPSRGWTRDELYEDRLKRYDRPSPG